VLEEQRRSAVDGGGRTQEGRRQDQQHQQQAANRVRSLFNSSCATTATLRSIGHKTAERIRKKRKHHMHLTKRQLLFGVIGAILFFQLLSFSQPTRRFIQQSVFCQKVTLTEVELDADDTETMSPPSSVGVRKEYSSSTIQSDSVKEEEFPLRREERGLLETKGEEALELNPDWPYRPPANKTLIVIYGLLRTLEWTVDSIIKNVILPNQPCDVIISIDQPIGHITHKIVQKLGPYLTMLFDKDDTDFNAYLKDFNQTTFPKEFYLMERAFRWVEKTNRTYGYALKIRTDNFAKHPIQISSLYGDHPNFNLLFGKFEKGLTQELNPSQPLSFAEKVWGWFFTGGIPVFARGMILSRPDSAWSRLHPMEWNKKLKAAVDASDPAEGIQPTVERLANEFRTVYLIGSTWIHFGRYDLMRNLSQHVSEWWGTLLWEDFGFAATSPHWKYVTESHLRLSHLKSDLALIDLKNLPDYRLSFNLTDVTHVQENFDDDEHFYWIVRGCDKHKMKANCK